MPNYIRIHVKLLGVKPKLWRRFLLRESTTFANLHLAIQDACGWEDCHLYMFRARKGRSVIASIPTDGWGDSDPDARVVKVSSILDAKNKGSCLYEYDFGDGWLHEVTCEGIEEHSEQFGRRLLDGAGTFPPEDCGGAPGYARCVAAVTGRGWAKWGSEQERREQVEWLGNWRPDSFESEKVRKHFGG